VSIRRSFGFLAVLRDGAGQALVEYLQRTTTGRLERRLEERMIYTWKASAPDASQARDDAYLMVRAIAELRNELTALAAEPTVDRFNRRLKSV